ncbi:hypothetical protein GPJ56_009432 [Histomonas meleagridis]|uniref:uncharacterized protein n=1 Tax=Histomonas meleagridis TaxID=135588 RepID=UPI003559A616|nr:hypothetical protein GPJ56_009432 [Histomonas meleagridis]KAH0797464.1 hypothetical protein GO595_009785 [Histomonas meleagridis]
MFDITSPEFSQIIRNYCEQQRISEARLIRQAFDTPINYSTLKAFRNQSLSQQIDEAQFEIKVINDVIENDAITAPPKNQQQIIQNSQAYQQNQVAKSYMKMEEEKLKALKALYAQDQNTHG